MITWLVQCVLVALTFLVGGVAQANLIQTFSGSFVPVSGAGPGWGSDGPTCDNINCQGNVNYDAVLSNYMDYQRATPKFSLIGYSLLSADIAYSLSLSLRLTVRNASSDYSIRYVSTDIPAPDRMWICFQYRHCEAGDAEHFIATVSTLMLGEPTSTIIGAGQTYDFGASTTLLTGTRSFLPGDPAMSSYLLGMESFPLATFWSERIDAEADAVDENGNYIPGLSSNFARALIHYDFSGTYKVTYRYCDSRADQGCPPPVRGYNAVPEAGTLALLSLGLAGLIAAQRRKR